MHLTMKKIKHSLKFHDQLCSRVIFYNSYNNGIFSLFMYGYYGHYD